MNIKEERNKGKKNISSSLTKSLLSAIKGLIYLIILAETSKLIPRVSN